MIRLVLVLAVGLVLEAAGVVLISRGQKEMNGVFRPEFRAVWNLALEAATNRHLLMGVALEAGFFGCLLFLLSKADVSFVWPLTSLSLVVTTLTAKWILDEQVSTLRWMGVLLIVLGAGVVLFTESQKRARNAQPAPSPSQNAGNTR